jgi:hypothetical protein
MIHPKKNPRDINQLAAKIVALSTGQIVEPEESPEKQYAREFARKGGLVGGKARAAKLSKEERSNAAKKAAEARWKAHNP